MAHAIDPRSTTMKRGTMRAAIIAGALTVCAAMSGVSAAAYPEKPIKILATASPGAATDITARLLAEHMSKTLKQPVVIENQGGGGGTIAPALVARAPADGYTLLITATAMIAAPFLYAKLPFDVEKNFAPVSQIVTFYNILAAYPGFPPKTLPDFMSYAKSNVVSLAGGNLGGQSWLMTMKLNAMANTKLNYIAYKGTGPALTDVMGGHVNAVFSDPASLKALLADGKLKAVGVTSPKRSRSFPDTPAFAEAVPGYEQEGWIGLLAPAGTPKEVVQKLHSAVAEALADPVVKQRLLDGDFGIVGNTPEEFAAVIRNDLTNYGRIIKETGLTLEDPK
jgi:tripartite-type tricarboxylate transporter receptor subunit TctC